MKNNHLLTRIIKRMFKSDLVGLVGKHQREMENAERAYEKAKMDSKTKLFGKVSAIAEGEKKKVEAAKTVIELAEKEKTKAEVQLQAAQNIMNERESK